ncbi:MAG: hypothetical protein EOO56_24205 [Hymenobacter sp.]|nr:MAG: hypothetical protein EOO56_24205 [Hymenobacter sp.]
MMSKFLFFCGVLLLGSLAGFAQVTQPFLKIAHLGTQGRPIVDLYLTAQTPELNPAQGMDGRYRFESVCLLPEANLTPLLRYAESYAAKNKSDSKNDKYGTFEITLGPNAARQAAYTRSKALAFLSGAVQVLQKQPQQTDTEEALRRLELTIRRVSAGAK